jgi:Spy/CpxP family protein refolding chaperone
VTTIRSIAAACAGLLVALILQAPAVAGPGATNGSGLAPIVGLDVPQTAPAETHPGPQGRQSSNRPPPNGPRPNAGSALIDDNQRWDWWNDAEVKRELALTEATVKTINDIFRERWTNSRAKGQEFYREREKLNRMLSEPTVSEDSFELQVTKVDRLRSELDTGRTMMLFRMMRQLRPDQVKKLEEIAARRSAQNAQRDRDGRRGSGPGRQ